MLSNTFVSETNCPSVVQHPINKLEPVQTTTELELSTETLLQVLEKCSPKILGKMASVSSKMKSICFSNHVWKKQIESLLSYSGVKVDENFESDLKRSGINYYTAVMVLGGAYVRWSNICLTSDNIIHSRKAIDRVILPLDGTVRVKIDGGFDSYINNKFCLGLKLESSSFLGEELNNLSSISNLSSLSKQDILYSNKHLFLRIKDTNGWCLLDYCKGNELKVLSLLPKFNGITNSSDVLEIASDKRHLVALYRVGENCGRIVHYDWKNDRICGDYLLKYKDYGRLDKIFAYFSNDGLLIKLCVNDDTKGRISIIDMVGRGIIKVNLNKNCLVAVPLFKKNLLWTLDHQSRSLCFSLTDGTCISSKDILCIGTSFVRKAFYIESIKRMVLISEDNQLEVGEIKKNGGYVRCGNFDTAESIDTTSFEVNSVISGPNSLALVGTYHIRHMCIHPEY